MSTVHGSEAPADAHSAAVNSRTPLKKRLQHIYRPFRQTSRISRGLIFSGLGVVVFFLLVAFVAPLLYPYSGTQYRKEVAPGEFVKFPALAPPSVEHPFGTTRDGFDVLARIIDAASLAFVVMAIAVSIAMLVGVTLGLYSGYRGGKFDRALVTVMDSVYAFPSLVMAIIVGFVLGSILTQGVFSAAAAVAVVYIPQYYRVVRNHTFSVKQEPFVEAARSFGAKDRTIVGRYIFFNVVQTVPVILTLNAADSILVLAALGFLGYGVPYPIPEWGLDIAKATNDVAAGIWWTAFWPGMAIVLLVTALTLVGEGLNDVVNPLLRTRGKAGRKIAGMPRSRRKNGDGGVTRSADAVRGAAQEKLAAKIRDLRVGYRTSDGPLWAVDGVDLNLRAGECVGLVGESGSGKSSMGRAMLRLMPPGGVVQGEVEIDDRDIVNAPESTVRKMRGEGISLMFQEPMTRLNPLMRVSDHFVEMIRTHQPKTSRQRARTMARDALMQVGIPPTRVDNYPHEFSGGMRQRVMLAMAIVLTPRTIVADEPTTALDVIVESQILSLLERLRSEENVGILLITHNLGVVAEACDRVAVMYAGRIVEMGPVDQIFNDPKHPYTRGLVASTISLNTTELHSVGGYPPNLVEPPTGCRFADRCAYAMDHCTKVDPELTTVGPEQQAACLLYPGAGADVPADVRTPSGDPQKSEV
ncbi:peptide/nickel transport system permease protein [Saccharopolyspora lacisalsi]|uniref:Peptide/nickel transport system permease protein n=1 Tax=Halosaccharopolyspora lacisalsi TaxID=1000566 RepID=A0A839DVT5_9PSEU|nr:dipeptide/oligopeptide/nickel ABC transporter permease/ATP-binding protein [Halosaccharopolyspora lacisalsi]MBA8824356.1 peptide/nickel transport system permease protein [Halosaccharopolyspora lacisalsi]